MNNHPKVPYTVSKWTYVCNTLSMLGLLGTIGFLISIYPSLPDTIPIHFNAQGVADGWGSKATIFLIPMFALIIFVPMYFLSKVPHVFNYPFKITEDNAPRVYPVAQLFVATLNVEFVLLFTYLSLDITGQYLGPWLLISALAVPIITIIVSLIALNRVA